MTIAKHEFLNHLAKVLHSPQPLEVVPGSREEQIQTAMRESMRQDDELREIAELAQARPEPVRVERRNSSPTQPTAGTFVFRTTASDGRRTSKTFEEMINDLTSGPATYCIPGKSLTFIVTGHSLFVRCRLVIIHRDDSLAGQAFTLTVDCDNGVRYSRDIIWDGETEHLDFLELPLSHIVRYTLSVGGVEATRIALPDASGA